MRIDDSLLQALHRGTTESPLWQDFLKRLQASSGARFATLVFRPAGQEGAIALTEGAGLSKTETGLTPGLGERDPLPYHTMREGRVYALEDLLDPAIPAQEQFVRTQMHPLGLTSLRAVRVAEPGGLEAWLSCVGDRQLGAAAGALLLALAPHLRIALGNFAALERERFRSAITGEAFNRLKLGWLTLDAQCRIVAASENMEQMFQWGAVLRRGRYDRLVPASPATDRALTALVRGYATQGEGRPQAFNLSQDPWVDMLVTPVFDSDRLQKGSTAAIVYISGDRRSQADRRDQLVDLFGLLPSEARLAWLLAQATSISEAAEALGLSLETARNYSKKIYAKTGAKGQADLVRIVLTSVLALS
jgi:DNA-binding CsgD family transcriptional regulator